MSMCTVTVDATTAVGRVVFDGTSYVGVDVEDYSIGYPIDVESGVQNITIYNGAQNGQLTFVIAFSGALDVFQKVTAFAVTATIFCLL